ncbi:MAG: universal stress protein [Draconibacterium sp.]|nr:universal stress protein [Draconibacterium sp.]
MKKALVTLDYNSSALKRAEMGFSIASKMGVNLTLMHIEANPLVCDEIDRVAIQGFGIKTESHTEIAKNNNELKSLAKKFLLKSELNLGDDYVLTSIKENESADSVLKLAKKIKADLIYIINMGSQSRMVVKDMLVDRITENAYFQTIVSVLVIPLKS